MITTSHEVDKLQWTRKQVRLGDLVGWEQNPRESSRKQARRIVESERAFGQPLPFLVNPYNDSKNKYELLDGHQRLAAWMAEYGADFQVEVAVANRELTEDEHKKLVINLHATAVGQWDWDTLASWDSETLGSWGMDEDLVGVWKSDLQNLRHMVSLPKELGENDTTNLSNALDEFPVLPGDVFTIGDHRIACGDSKDDGLVKRLFGAKLATLVFTDPPWNVDYTGGMKKRDELEDDDIPDDEWIPAISQSLKIAPTTTDAAMYLVYGMMNTLQTYQAVSTADWRVIQNLVWVKQNAVFGRRNSKHYKYQHEGIIYATRDMKKQPRFFGDNNEVSVWSHDRLSKNVHHPTEKPIDLYEHGIINSSQMSEVVYDPFSGSGTLLIACQNRARCGYAVEKDPRYVAVTLQRMTTLFPELSVVKDDAG